jgi:hypothetical protein
MLYGPIYNKDDMKYTKSNKNNKNYSTILPEYYSDFKQYFIDQPKNNIKNEDKFQNRIFGLVSYYGDMYFEQKDNIKDEIKISKIKENFPDRLPIKIEVIEMTSSQNIEYYKARDIEKNEVSKFSGGIGIVKEKSKVSTSYRIKSRQLSNIFIPEKNIKNILDKIINITLKDTSNNEERINKTLEIFNEYSPKMVKIFNNIKSHYYNDISLVYSTFLDYGIFAFGKLLELNNYRLFSNENINNKNTKYKYYAIFSGDQTIEEKANILQTINSKENINGDLISILLISKSGAEGLDLKNVRSVHIMEPYWNYSLIEQIIARAVRYKSHILLEKDKQNVQTYIYLSDYNKDFLKKEKDKIKDSNNGNKSKNKSKDSGIELTTDITLFKNAIKNQELIYNFLKTIASTSIECPFFNIKNINYNCFNCISNNKALFYNDIDRDLEISNNCIRKGKITAKEIIINNNKYYYSNDKEDIKIFKYNSDLDGYIQVNDEKIKKIIKEDLKDKII